MVRRLKFWEKEASSPTLPQTGPAAARRFSAKPRTDLVDATTMRDPAKADALQRLLQRRDAVLFDVDQATMAAAPENPWRERASLIDEALVAVRSDRERVSKETGVPGDALPTTPITEIAVDQGPPPAVSFTIGPERFMFREELDWAERGFQLARSDLQHESGEPAHLIPPGLPADQRADLIDHLAESLFVFASDLRDRTIASEHLPQKPTLADLARPSNAGGWHDWGGGSPVERSRLTRLRELDAEEQRLLTERETELTEMAKLADRLPIARKRLADVDAEIAKARG